MSDKVSCICRRWVRQQTPVVEITGTIDEEKMEFPVKVFVWAASPADRNQSYTGSALPFPNAEIAFGQNSVVLDDYREGDFKVTLLEPNAFYDFGGSVYVPPTIFMKVVSKQNPSNVAYSSQQLATIGTPYRALNYTMPEPVRNQRTGPAFYSGRESLPVRSQYDILVDSSFPCKDEMPSNFWGLKPPQ